MASFEGHITIQTICGENLALNLPNQPTSSVRTESPHAWPFALMALALGVLCCALGVSSSFEFLQDWVFDFAYALDVACIAFAAAGVSILLYACFSGSAEEFDEWWEIAAAASHHVNHNTYHAAI